MSILVLGDLQTLFVKISEQLVGASRIPTSVSDWTWTQNLAKPGSQGQVEIRSHQKEPPSLLHFACILLFNYFTTWPQLKLIPIIDNLWLQIPNKENGFVRNKFLGHNLSLSDFKPGTSLITKLWIFVTYLILWMIMVQRFLRSLFFNHFLPLCFAICHFI